MVIHNFFTDVLLSVLELFESYIFDNKPYFYQNTTGSMRPNGFFKSVQFNLGNKNFQVGNYKDSNQLEFPTGIFTFVSDETAFGDPANILIHLRLWN